MDLPGRSKFLGGSNIVLKKLFLFCNTAERGYKNQNPTIVAPNLAKDFFNTVNAPNTVNDDADESRKILLLWWGKLLKVGAMNTKGPRKLILSTVYRIFSGITSVLGLVILLVPINAWFTENRLDLDMIFTSIALLFTATVFSGIAQVLDLILEIAENTKQTASNSILEAKSS